MIFPKKRRPLARDWSPFGNERAQKERLLQSLTEQSSRRGRNPLARLSQRAQERSGRVEELEAEKRALSERLRGLEGESASLSVQIRMRESDLRALTAECEGYETGCRGFEDDLTILGEGSESW